MSRTIHVLVAPRSRLGEAIKREQARKPGVYFLVGDEPEPPQKQQVYIGEADVVADRIKSHANDESKDFFERFCLITSKDENLNKAHVRYLESRLLEIAKESGLADLKNVNEPQKKNLSGPEVAYMESYLKDIAVLLPIVGFNFLRPKVIAVSPTKVVPPDGGQPQPIELILESPKYGYKARAIEVNGEITVLAGSEAQAQKGLAHQRYAPLREQLIKDGRLKPKAGKPFLEFAEHVPFASASAAGSVINNCNTNGRTEWKLKSTGQTLKEWQDAQVV